MASPPVENVSPVAPVIRRERPIVLHVDDDVASLMMAEGALEDAGFDVVHAEDGLQAIEQFHATEPDLIIMDALMPNMDGFEAIAAIRSMPLGAFVPILMITGLDDHDSIARAYHEGATDFLTKPVNFFILPYRVQYMLRSKRTADELRSSQAKLDNAQRIARLGHWEWDVASNALDWSPEFARILDLPEDRLHGNWQEFINRVNENDAPNLQFAARHAVDEARSFHVEFHLSVLGDTAPRSVRLEAEPHLSDAGVCTHMLGTLQDITERTDAQRQIHNLAYYDLVTGLPNRAQLYERLNQALKFGHRHKAEFAVLFLDLDHFKQVNDTLGHDAGDALLSTVAQRLTSVVRDSDSIFRPEVEANDEQQNPHIVARLGGDEFVVLLGQIHRADDAARVAQRIAFEVCKPCIVGTSEVAVTTTIGISVFPADGDDAETLMKHADVAMYHAKEQGRDGYQFYSREIHEQALARFRMESALKTAVENNELSLMYQPKIDMHSGEVVGVEALLRWHHPEFGQVAPSDFIPVAEETDLILSIGKWVLNRACEQKKCWADQGLGGFSVAVNCSSVQFVRGNVIDDLDQAIAVTGLDPKMLEIELTESFLLQNIDQGIEILERMKTLGIQVAIDDFGTGFSSLSYLKRLPVDKLKIDQSFVRDLQRDPGDAAIVSAIITLSHNLDLTVVAEGVEDEAQFRCLADFGCNEVQGYYISRPLTAEQFEAWLASRASQSLHSVASL